MYWDVRLRRHPSQRKLRLLRLLGGSAEGFFYAGRGSPKAESAAGHLRQTFNCCINVTRPKAKIQTL